jgi:hypothetical protein
MPPKFINRRPYYFGASIREEMKKKILTMIKIIMLIESYMKEPYCRIIHVTKPFQIRREKK